MKFADSFKIAAHNLWQNKSRTLLTVIIVLVVSALIMAMCLIGTNFMSNNTRALKMQLDAEGTSYRLEDASFAEGLSIVEAARKYPDGVSYSGIRLNAYEDKYDTIRFGLFGDNGPSFASELVLADFAYSMSAECGEIVSGRIWNAADNASNGVWLSDDAMQYLSEYGYDVRLGDTLDLRVTVSQSRQTIGNENVTKAAFDTTYVVRGIFRAAETEDNYYYSSTPLAIIALDSLSERLRPYNLGVYDLYMGFESKASDYDYRTTEKAMSAFVKEMNTKIGKGVNQYDGKTYDRFTNGFLEDSYLMRMIGLLVMGVLVILAFLILLLSIGSVANTIIISVDKNRKFIGLMKAMGMKNKGVKQIVYKEALMTVFAGVLLATALILALSGIMSKLLNSVLGSMYGSLVGGSFTMTFTISPIVPLVTALIFFGMAILFSKGSLNKMGKADVITIISEVA